MHSAIIQVVLSEDAYSERQRAASLLAGIQAIAEDKAALRLGDYVWQIDFRASPFALARIVDACERLAIPYRILPLADAPQWIEGNPKPP